MNEIKKEIYPIIKKQLNQRQATVLKALKEIQPATGQEIANLLGVPLHTISGRITELKQKKRVEVIGKRYPFKGSKYPAAVLKVA